MPEIRFLDRLNVREAWPHEAGQFTPWLAREEPLALSSLFAICGIDLGTEPTIQTEVRVPGIGRKLDILIESEGGERIAIENQFSEIDHDHLTRALAYAVGLEATTVIVIAESHKPEFIAVANYLNEAALGAGERGIRFFLVTVSVLGMPGSGIFHPTFAVVAQPNEWKAAAAITAETAQDSGRPALIYDFHERILPVLREKTGLFSNVTPSSNMWKRSSAGVRKDVGILYSVSRNTTSVLIWFSAVRSPGVNRAGLQALKAHEDEIDKELAGYEVEWPSGETTSMRVVVTDCGYADVQESRFAEVADIVEKMSRIASTYKAEIVAAMTQAEEVPFDVLPGEEELAT
jgi:hypothetical protein